RRASRILNDRRAPLLHADEIDLGEPMHRLTHDRPRHAELLGEGALGRERAPGREVPSHDRRGDLVEDAIGRVLATYDLELADSCDHAPQSVTRPGHLVTKLVS